MPNLAANLQGMLVGLGISGSGSLKRKETWRQQFESAPGYFILFLILPKFRFFELIQLLAYIVVLNLAKWPRSFKLL
jgi:hypothetical protein